MADRVSSWVVSFLPSSIWFSTAGISRRNVARMNRITAKTAGSTTRRMKLRPAREVSFLDCSVVSKTPSSARGRSCPVAAEGTGPCLYPQILDHVAPLLRRAHPRPDSRRRSGRDRGNRCPPVGTRPRRTARASSAACTPSGYDLWNTSSPSSPSACSRSRASSSRLKLRRLSRGWARKARPPASWMRQMARRVVSGRSRPRRSSPVGTQGTSGGGRVSIQRADAGEPVAQSMYATAVARCAERRAGARSRGRCRSRAGEEARTASGASISTPGT